MRRTIAHKNALVVNIIPGENMYANIANWKGLIIMKGIVQKGVLALGRIGRITPGRTMFAISARRKGLPIRRQNAKNDVLVINPMVKRIIPAVTVM